MSTADELTRNVAASVRDGHAFEAAPLRDRPDIRRWACRTCGDEALDNGGSVYGGATLRTCAESLEYWRNLPPGPVPPRPVLSESEEHIALTWVRDHYPDIHAAAARYVRKLRAADDHALKGTTR